MRLESRFGQTYLPYAIAKLSSDEFLPLNRYYKPIGIMSGEWVDYHSQPGKIKIKGLTNARAERIGLTVLESRDGNVMFYLYNDGTIPDKSKSNWDRYQNILHQLAALGVKSANSLATSI